MNKNVKKIVGILLMIILIGVGSLSYSHSGRTDANGGHRDNNNKSGLGGYHYHCGGYPAHLHPDGVCPYSSGTSSTSEEVTTTSSSSSSSKTSSTGSTTNTKAKTKIEATEVNIDKNVEEIRVGESKILKATVLPDNVTDSNVTWKSSDEEIATVTSLGMVYGKKEGNVDITVATSNGITDTITIAVKDDEKPEENIVNNNVNTLNTTNTNTTSEGGSEAAGILGGLGIIGLIGAGCFGASKGKK